MGLVYLPTFTIKINHSCRLIYHIYMDSMGCIFHTSAHLGLGSTFIFLRFEVIMKRRQFFSDDEMSGVFNGFEMWMN